VSSVDVILLISLTVTFAVLLTVHVALAAALLGREPWWRGAVALVVPPLAPYWAYREQMVLRAAVWTISAVVYVSLRVVAK